MWCHRGVQIIFCVARLTNRKPNARWGARLGKAVEGQSPRQVSRTEGRKKNELRETYDYQIMHRD